MTWEYALIGLVVGIIIGAVAMRFGNRKLRQQQALQYELEKNKAELDEYREELVSHFARSAELLDTMAHDYRQLYQHMAKSSRPSGTSATVDRDGRACHHCARTA